MQGLFVLSSPWPILLTYIDIDGIARLLFCSRVFFSYICYWSATTRFLPICLSINVMGNWAQRKLFVHQLSIWGHTYTYVWPSLCYNFFVCVRPKGCKRDTVKRIKPLGWCWFVFKVCCCSIIIVLLPEIWEFN